MNSELALGAAVLWGSQAMPAIVLSVEGDRVELAYRRRRQLRTGFTRIDRIVLCPPGPQHRRLSADIAPRLQLALFD